jgi:hypothetical protein
VPEAAIDEDSNPGAGEDNVWSDLDAAGINPEILPEPQAFVVEGRPQLHLRFRARAPNGLHVATSTFVRGRGVASGSARG